MHLDELNFIRESNRIEGITRPISESEIAEYVRFIALDMVTLEDMRHFVRIYQPNAKLRDKVGLDVRVGNHIPPRGCPEIKDQLVNLLSRAYQDWNPYVIHLEFETLHPFTDCNGRSGRMLWAWQMQQQNQNFSLGFLHTFYYQTLANHRT